MDFKLFLEFHHYQQTCDLGNKLLRKAKINYSYDIPYLAGYSKDGKTFYIDRHVPENATINNKRINFHNLLLKHESVEKAAEMSLNWSYRESHKVATKAERAMVESFGIKWNSYNDFCKKWIKDADSEKIKKVPKNLDLMPYHAYKDNKLIEKMKKFMI